MYEDYHFLKPCWLSNNILTVSRYSINLEYITLLRTFDSVHNDNPGL